MRATDGAGKVYVAWDTYDNGYDEPFGLVHRRRLFLSADGLELMGEETLSGGGGRSFALRFHLHPSVQASITQSSQAAFLKSPHGGGWRLRVQGGDLSLADSVYLGQAHQPGGTRRHAAPRPAAGGAGRDRRRHHPGQMGLAKGRREAITGAPLAPSSP